MAGLLFIFYRAMLFSLWVLMITYSLSNRSQVDFLPFPPRSFHILVDCLTVAG